MPAFRSWSKEDIIQAMVGCENISQILKKLKVPKNQANRLKLVSYLRDYNIDVSNLMYGDRTGRYRLDFTSAEQNTKLSYERERARIKNLRQQKRKSKDPAILAPIIFEDFRKSDKKKKLDNDLDLQFVTDMISKECLYCGETTIRMTLDRIDNTLGHMKKNVNPACRRCNSIRGNMPYQAWLFIVPRIREARQAGLFGVWQGIGNKVKSASEDNK